MSERARYHVTPSTNWLNDPNGPIHHDGRYHLFYQYNPAGLEWGPPHWGHVSSSDLVRWREHPPALSPEPGGPTEDGCWSGCARIVDGRPTIFLTGVVGHTDEDRVESVCRADGSDDLESWTLVPEPLIAGPPAGHPTGFHRDPFLYRHRDRWRLLVGSAIDGPDGPQGAVLLYESSDLASWTYLGVLYTRPAGAGPVETGRLWECPQLLHLDGRDVLVFSVNLLGGPHPLRHAVYVVGELADTRFRADAVGYVDHGNVFYAPAVTVDATGRPLVWGWVQEATPAAGRGADHAGALSLPRTVALDGDALVVRPVAELAALREGVTAVTASVEPGTRRRVPLPDQHYELVASIRGSAGAVTLRLPGGGGGPSVTVLVDVGAGLVGLTATAEAPGVAPHDLHLAAGARDLRLFVDGSIVELFVDDARAATVRAYDLAGPDVEVVADGGDANVEVEAYPIALDAVTRHDSAAT